MRICRFGGLRFGGRTHSPHENQQHAPHVGAGHPGHSVQEVGIRRAEPVRVVVHELPGAAHCCREPFDRKALFLHEVAQGPGQTDSEVTDRLVRLGCRHPDTVPEIRTARPAMRLACPYIRKAVWTA